MIAKHVPMRAAQKSDFAGLVAYITDSQSKEHRLGIVSVSNCATENLKAATAEILATQHGNTRAGNDKTYHLLLSFRAGEQPSLETLKAVEERICAGLGFKDHQRISAIHNDTDNLHIHIAINKIHPVRGTIHEPYKAYKALAQLCDALELEFGLQKDNHAPSRTLSEGRAADMERHAGIESLVTWIKTECLAELKTAKSWEQLHQVLGEHGLMLKERGAGLVIEADGIQVKASTIARDFSKRSLEERFGPYVGNSSEADNNKPKKQYQKKPVHQKINTAELYAKYKTDQANLAALRTAELAKLQRIKDRSIADAKRNNKLRRAATAMVNTTSVSKKFLYSQASASLKDTLSAINSDYRKGKEQVNKNYQRRTWVDWLKHQATAGDDKALEALRARESAGLKGNTIKRGDDDNRDQKGRDLPVDNITKKGTIIYRAGASAIRDDGDKLQVATGTNTAGIEAALKLAIERYGNKITLTGTPEFKAQVISVAVKSNLPITFADAGLENIRKQHAEKLNDSRIGRRPNSGSNAGDGSTSSNHHQTGRANGRQRRDRRTGLQQRNSKPDVARVGRVPPPHSKNRLRRLSQLGVVQLANGSEVLLPRNVFDHMEHKGTESDNKLRRNGIGPGVTGDQLAAAKKYVAERQEKLLKGFDIPKHSLYNGGTHTAKFAGVRNIDGYPMALLKMDDDSISVLPIDKATAQRLTKVALNQEVSVTEKGSLKTSRGRSR